MIPGGSIMGWRGKPQPERMSLLLEEGCDPVRAEIYDAHGETTESVMDSLLAGSEEYLGPDRLHTKTGRYYAWLECVREQLRGHHMPPDFRVAYLNRGHLGLTGDELRRRWKNGGKGVSVRKVLNRLDAFNRKHGTELRPCRPGIPFALKKLDTYCAPFHHGFVGTGLQDRDGHKSVIHVRAPLDLVSISRSLNSEPVAYQYFDDGYWEPGGAQTFVFEY